MSLSVEPKKGIRLQLSHYLPIRSWQGGGKFWEHDFQLAIRQGKLADFLPRAVEEGGSVLYEQMIDGVEAVSESVPLNDANAISPAQFETLRDAIAELKAKAEDPHCDATIRRIIESFRLPDPARDMELYRLYGRGRDRRLLVLWGVEKEARSALLPAQALARVPQAAAGGGALGKSWLWLLLAAALIAGGWFFWQSRDRAHRHGHGKHGGEYAGAPTAGADDDSAGQDDSAAAPPRGTGGNAGPADSPAGPGRAPAPGDPGAASPGTTGLPVAGSSPTASPTADGAMAGRGMSATPTPATPGSTSVSSPNSAGLADGATSPRSSKPDDSATSPAPGEAEPSSSPAASPASAATSPSPKPGANPSPKPDFTPTSSPAGKATPRPGSTPTPKRDDSPKASPSPSLRKDEASPTPAMPDGPGEAPTPANTSGSTAPPADDPVSATPASPTPAVPTNGSAPAAPKAASLQIISARSGSKPKDGKVEILLNALARDASGAPLEMPKITEWRIDNEAQRNKDGSPVAASSLPVTLAKGIHRVTVSSRQTDGTTLKSEADVDVNVKVTEESSVQVRPIK